MPFTTSGGTAILGQNFTISPNNGVLTIPAGSNSASIMITPIDDGIYLGNKTVMLNLGIPTGAILGGATYCILTITDDVATPKACFANTSTNVYDYAQTITIPIQLSAPCDVAPTVSFTLNAASTATSTDYTITTSWRALYSVYQVFFNPRETTNFASILISNRTGIQDSSPGVGRVVKIDLNPLNWGNLGPADHLTFTLTILDKEVVITNNPSSQTVNWGQTANFSVAATGAPPFYYQWMKNGMNISGATGASCTTTPTVVSDNGATYSVLVSNAYSCATSSVANLTVQHIPLPTVNINIPSSGAQFDPPADLYIAAGANAGVGGWIQKVDFYDNGTNWLGEVTTLPSNPYGLSLNNLASGTYNLTAIVTDNQGQTATSSVVQVTVTGSSRPALSIVTASALTGTVGIAYNHSLAASGGTPGYTWSVISNGLPAGLGLVTSSGAITGTPVKVLTTNVTVRVTDAVGSNVCRVFNLTVMNAYSQWSMQQFGSTNAPMLATPAHDGIANLMKYALGIDSLIPGYQNHFSCGMTNLSGQNHFTLTFIRPDPAPLGVSYVFDAANEVRTNAWSSASITATTNINGDGTATITAHDNTISNLVRFLRLLVNGSP